MKNRLVLFFVLVLVIFLSCNGDSGTNPKDNPVKITEEARLAALWLTNELSPPLDVAQQIANDLEQIRAEYADLLAIFNQEFIFPADPKELIVGLAADAVAAIRAGTYNAWNPPNADFDVVEIDTFFYGLNFNFAILHFEDFWNPFKVAPYYSELEGIDFAEPDSRGGDFSNFYPWYVGGQIAYLFREGWGDCPAGCIFSHFWYVRKINGRFEIIGDFSTENNDPLPDWWDEISDAYYAYSYYWFITSDE